MNFNNVAKVNVSAAGDMGGTTVTLGSNSFAGGDAIAYPGNIVTLGTSSKVHGDCVTGFSGSVNDGGGAQCGSLDTSGTSGKLALLRDAGYDAITFETFLMMTPATELLSPLNLAAGKKATISGLPVPGFLNIIEITAVTLGNSSTLTLFGDGVGRFESWVLRKITGDLKLGNGARIVLKGGIDAGQVLIYVGGSVAAWDNSTTVNATLLAPHSACAAGSGAIVNGAVICGGDVTFRQNATLIFNPSTIDLPMLPVD